MGRIMTRGMAIGWAMTLGGLLLWGYGYYASGHPPLIGWDAFAPAWIANYLPTMEAELGFAVMLAAMVPMYWPKCQS